MMSVLMQLPEHDTVAARNLMVDGQIRPNKVADRRILNAMRTLPRERFLPPGLAHLAYVDEDVPLSGGRVLTEPLVTARLAQLATPRSGERALVVAAGTGYLAALLAACGCEVTALEEDEKLIAIARVALAATAPSVKIVAGKLAEGWPSAAPYDVILIDGAVEQIPPALAAQLRTPGGRLVGVLANGVGPGHAVLAEASEGGRLRAQPEFDCAIPVLPAFRPTPTFQF
jgi:protein-L-isoaspartate(D-aspartate) O-methyltransferase